MAGLDLLLPNYSGYLAGVKLETRTGHPKMDLASEKFSIQQVNMMSKDQRRPAFAVGCDDRSQINLDYVIEQSWAYRVLNGAMTKARSASLNSIDCNPASTLFTHTPDSQLCRLSMYSLVSFVREHAHDQKEHVIFLCIHYQIPPKRLCAGVPVSKISSPHASHRFLSSSHCLLCPLTKRSAASPSFPLGLPTPPSHSLHISLNISYEGPFH